MVCDKGVSSLMLGLVAVIAALGGFFFALSTTTPDEEPEEAPKIYVARCAFEGVSDSCGALARESVVLSTDEFLTSTDNWAVGREGNYKLYMSCFAPGDEKYIDGNFSSMTVAVAGPALKGAWEHATRLMSGFGELIVAQGGSIAHCLEQP